MTTLEEKQERLENGLAAFPSLLVAFSGGVDSTLLAAVAHRVLGDRMMAVTARSTLHTRRELQMASDIAAAQGFRHEVVDSCEMALPTFLRNGPNRCYHCKKALLTQLRGLADCLGFDDIAHGANLDDDDDERPGMTAAVQLGVHAPLRDAGLNKTDVRRMARSLGLPNWNLPANACLATRVPGGMRLTPELLATIGEAEAFIRSMGIDALRVRHHGEIARIEADPADWHRLLSEDQRRAVVDHLHAMGYRYVTLDLAGYQRGSMNRRRADG